MGFWRPKPGAPGESARSRDTAFAIRDMMISGTFERAGICDGWAVSRKKDCFLTSLFYRVAARRSLKRAAMAVGHRVLTLAYFIIRDGSQYREAGQDYYDRQNPERTVRRLTQRLERIGYQVALTKTDASDLTTTSHSKQPKYGTTRWNNSCSQAFSVPQTPKTPKAPPATPDICPMCATWGIACIYVRNSKSFPNQVIKPNDSMG